MPHAPAPIPAPPAELLVTSSDLVRHFGLWQERATRAPLYILHRGRPRFVLTSIETMDALCSPRDAPAGVAPDAVGGHIDITAVLDGLGELVLLATSGNAIVGASRGARAHFGVLAAPGGRVDEIAPLTARPFLTAAIKRVLDSGTTDSVEIPSAARPGRTLAVTITAASHGIIVVGHDITTDEEVRALQAAAQAQQAAMLALGGVATATINPRGYLVAPGEALVTLCGLAREALTAVRFVTLAEIGARVALGEAIEAAMAGETPLPVDARLLVNRADPVAVRIGLAPLRQGTATDGAVAILRSR